MEKLKEEILVAIGHASMCWSNINGAGVFDSEQAEKVGDELLEFVKAHFTAQADNKAREVLEGLRKFAKPLDVDLIKDEITRQLKELEPKPDTPDKVEEGG